MELREPGLDQYGHKRLGGISNVIAEEIENRTGFETRVTVLGHVQRGGSPNPFDSVLGTRLGIAAIDAAQNKEYGEMVALQNGSIVTISLEEAVGSLKLVSPNFGTLQKISLREVRQFKITKLFDTKLTISNGWSPDCNSSVNRTWIG